MGYKQYQNIDSSASHCESLLAEVVNSDIWLSESFTKGQATLDLVFMSRYGGCVPPIAALAVRWQWSRTKVYAFLKHHSIEASEKRKDSKKDSEKNTEKNSKKDTEKNTESDSSNHAITLRESAPHDTLVEDKKTLKKAEEKTAKKTGKKTPEKTGAPPYIYNNISNILNNNKYNNNISNISYIGEIGRVQRGKENQDSLLQNQNKLDTPLELNSLPPTPSSADPLPPQRLTKKSTPLEPVDPDLIVWMTESEYDELNERYGRAWFKLTLSEMTDYAKSFPKKWDAYKDHASVFRRWSRNKQANNFTAIEEANGEIRWKKNYEQNQGGR